MKAVGWLGRAYCIASGLILAPLLIGFLVAYFGGMLPDQPLERIAKALEKEPQEEEAEEAEAEPENENNQDRTATDARAWSQRLQSVGDGILENLRDVEEARVRVAQEEADLQGLVTALTDVLSTLLEEPVTKEQLAGASDQLIARLREMGKSENRMPWMLDTLKSMEAKAVARLFSGAGSEEEGGLKDDEAVKLLGGLKPRKAGEVFAELGKVDPGQASRLLALLGKEEVQESGK